MTRLAHKLGLDSSLAFHDVHSLDEPELLALVPRPCYALLFTAPVSTTSEKFYREEEKSLPDQDGTGSSEPVWFAHQTIRHACGLMGLLYCVSNTQNSSKYIEHGSIVQRLLDETANLTSQARSEYIYQSQDLEDAHREAAQQGDSKAPRAEEYQDGHGYVAFVKGKDGRLWELEGRRKGAVCRGAMDQKEDLLSEKALELGPRSYVEREAAAGTGESRFSCIALGPAIAGSSRKQ